MIKTFAEWLDTLSPRNVEALEDTAMDLEAPYTANEILDQIVRYRGGISSGYELRCLVAEIYGCDVSNIR